MNPTLTKLKKKHWPTDDVWTPMVIVRKKQLLANIETMARKCQEKGVKLRPHFKAHKLLPIAQLQQANGAAGFTVAKLSEAQVLIDGGMQDILVAYPLWGEAKWDAYFHMATRTAMATIVDSEERLEAWRRQAIRREQKVDLYVKVDSGLHRVGYPPGEQLDKLIRAVTACTEVRFRGLLTHAGHIYGATSSEERETIGREEGAVLLRVAQAMRQEGIEIPEISVGSTPSVRFNLDTPGVTEVRPGNYVFHDATQVRLGVCPPDACALHVLTTVVACPTPDRRIIDCGAKVLALDQGAHGNRADVGYGMLSVPGWKLSRLSEEHGVLERTAPDGPQLPLGVTISVIPNHACPVINLAEEVTIVDDEGRPVDTWSVDARGCSR
ncbi:hypothetical protein GTO89_13980 [Heliobacterium gestii]|uniref:D-serine dehydratase-like domain-containing protein n=1 Tax=Heliomicrobium gestii TaxID=2699 RepID=A0A845LFG3_HELGE|nr:alanine racemase [Heliomicrobium gestii]MBM7867751.1 D-serine deaminase-like pyridoxal phosphate-dependent protein [Heliomicrobium gestii]MZP44144.1 hypothetical protein [Heliomicrobium gestii]